MILQPEKQPIPLKKSCEALNTPEKCQETSPGHLLFLRMFTGTVTNDPF